MPKAHKVTEPIKVMLASREVIESNLLLSLEEGGKVAIVATKQDLLLLIHALLFTEAALMIEAAEEELPPYAFKGQRKQLAADLEKLKKAAFP